MLQYSTLCGPGDTKDDAPKTATVSTLGLRRALVDAQFTLMWRYLSARTPTSMRHAIQRRRDTHFHHISLYISVFWSQLALAYLHSSLATCTRLGHSVLIRVRWTHGNPLAAPRCPGDTASYFSPAFALPSTVAQCTSRQGLRATAHRSE